MRHKLSTIDNMDITLIDTLVYRINRVSQAHVAIGFVGIITSTIITFAKTHHNRCSSLIVNLIIC